jgi:hypothetical protein
MGAGCPLAPTIIILSYCALLSPPLRLAIVIMLFCVDPERFRITVEALYLFNIPTPVAPKVLYDSTPSSDSDIALGKSEIV